MSKYTTEVRFLCESLTGHDESEDYSSIDEIIEDALPIIFSFDFPIFDEEYREVLETKILRHYYTREIGCETYGLWKLRLQTKLNEIMPYYNKLYESELFKYNPLYDVDMTTTNVGQKTGERTDVNQSETSNDNNATSIIAENEENTDTSVGSVNNKRESENTINQNQTDTDSRSNTFDGTRNTENEDTTVNSSSTQGGSTATNQNMYSDTPQGGLSNVDNLTYLTNYRKVLDAGTNSSATDSTGVASGKSKINDENTETSQGTKVSNNQSDESGVITDKQDSTNVNDSIRNRERSETVAGNTKQNSSSTNVGKTSNTEDYVMHVIGKSAGASYAKMLREFRDNLLNIDMDIIRDLADLFMLIW